MNIDKNSSCYTTHFKMTQKQMEAIETINDNTEAIMKCLKALKTIVWSAIAISHPNEGARLAKDLITMGIRKYYETAVTASLDAVEFEIERISQK